MRKIYITGHINPDLDCTASAFAYAHLKSKIDPKNEYIPIRCGALNEQTKKAFKKASIAPPTLYKKLVPVVGDVVRTDYVSLHAGAPVFEVLEHLYRQNISFIPIFDDGVFIGTVSINEISAYLLQQSNTGRPVYHFRIDNIAQVLPGKFIHRGEPVEFDASILTGAMPLSKYLKWSKTFTQKPLLVVGNRKRILSNAVTEQLPAIIITGVESEKELQVDFSAFKGTVYLSENDSAECIRLLRMSIAVNTIVNANITRIQKNENFEDAKRLLMDSGFRGLPVFDRENFLGIVTRRRFIEKPVKDLILVDHNEVHQSVRGAREARIVEILDHHRFAAEKTNTPIYIVSQPVGSTSTIVYQHYGMHGVELPEEIAIILQAGIISDTVNLKSPTTTEADRTALAELSHISGLDTNEYALEMFSQLKALKERKPDEIVTSDFKTYEHLGLGVGIGQVEVINLREAEKMTEQFSAALNRVAENKSLDWTLLLVTDVMKQNSILMSSNFSQGMKLLIYQPIHHCAFDLPNILSRKKQLLPEIFRVAEELNSSNALV